METETVRSRCAQCYYGSSHVSLVATTVEGCSVVSLNGDAGFAGAILRHGNLSVDIVLCHLFRSTTRALALSQSF